MAGKFDFDAPAGEATLVMTQTFDADCAAVFNAWTDKDQVSLWWDPTGAPLAVCEIDLRPGGAFLWTSQGEIGRRHPFGGIYTEIDPPKKLVFKSASVSGAERISTLTFTENNGGTILTIRIVCSSVEQRDELLAMRVEIGTALTLQNLARHLEKEAP